jgi:hypothetical protein
MDRDDMADSLWKDIPRPHGVLYNGAHYPPRRVTRHPALGAPYGRRPILSDRCAIALCVLIAFVGALAVASV